MDAEAFSNGPSPSAEDEASILHPSDILQEYISTCKGLQEPELNTRARGCLERMLKFPQYGFDFYDLSRLLLAEDVHTPSSYAQSCDLWEQHIDKTIPEDTHFRDVVQTFMAQDLTQKDRGTSSWELKQQVTNVRDLMFAALCVWSDFRNSCGDSAFFAFARAAVKVVLHNSQDLNLYLKALFPRTTLYLLPSTEYYVQSVHMSNYTQLFLEGAEDGTSTLVLDGSLVLTRKAQLKNLTIRNKEGNTFICTFDGNCSDDGMSLFNVKFQNVKLYVEYGGSILMDRVTFENCAHAIVANYLKELVLKDCKILHCQAGIIGNEIDKIELHSLHVNGISENRLFNINTKDVLFNGLYAPNVDKLGIINYPPMVPVRVGPRSDFTMFRHNASDLFLSRHDEQADRDDFEVLMSNHNEQADPNPEITQDHDAKLDSYAQFQSDGHITRPVTPEPAGALSAAPGKALARLAVMKEMHDESCAEQGNDKKAKTEPMEATRE